MSILAITVPCAGTVPLELPPKVYTALVVAVPGASELSEEAGPSPTGQQFLADHNAAALATVVQQPDGILPPVATPTTPTAIPNTTTWLTDFNRQVIITEPF